MVHPSTIMLWLNILMQFTLLARSLLLIQKQKTWTNILQSLIGLALLLHLINIYIYSKGLKVTFHVLPVVIVSYGPLFYAYVKLQLTKSVVLSRAVFYPLTGVVVIAIIHIIGHYHYNSFWHILYHLSIYLYSLVFLTLAIIHVYQRLRHGKHEWSWAYHMLILMGGFIVLIGLDYASFISSFKDLQTFARVGITVVGFAISLIFLLQHIFYPSIFRTEEGHFVKKNGTKLYPDSQELELAKRLSDYMDLQRPYLQSDLTIVKLSQQIEIQPHVLSSLINQYFKKNFIDYISDYRIDNARKLLSSNPDKKILAVALESGFSNKTSFNRTFKKLTGSAPSDFRNAGTPNSSQ